MQKLHPFKKIALKKNVDKRGFIYQVSKQLKIDYHHVSAVTNIFFEELIKELEIHRKIQIRNFGQLRLRKLASRVHIDVNTKLLTQVEGRQKLSFALSKKLRKFLSEHLDL